MKFLAFVFLIALIVGAVIYIVSTVKKARNRGEAYEDTQETPRDPFNSLRWLLPDYLNQREKKGTWVSIAVTTTKKAPVTFTSDVKSRVVAGFMGSQVSAQGPVLGTEAVQC